MRIKELEQSGSFLILAIFTLFVHEPDLLIMYGRLDFTLHIYLNNKNLTPARDGQFIPANYGQGHWLFHFNILIFIKYKFLSLIL
jgi:hypothetical protein